MTAIKDDTWRTKNVSHRLYVQAYAQGDIDDVEYGICKDLWDTWASHLGANREKHRYYEAENTLKDLGISIPPSLKWVRTPVGWAKKAVDSLADRVKFEGWRVDDEEAESQLRTVYERGHMRSKYAQALRSELIIGCDFVTVSKGDKREPPVIVTTHSAIDCAAKWDGRLDRVEYGMTVLDYDDESGQPIEANVYLPNATLHLMGAYGHTVEVERIANSTGQALMVALVNEKTEEKPFGQSRISKPVRGLADSAMRQSLRAEVNAEFNSHPQRYLLGTDGDPFDEVSRWEAYVGSIFNVDKTEDGTVPQYGELPAHDFTPHISYMRQLAAQFAGETCVPITELGIIHDNPSSAEAMLAADLPLIRKAETLVSDNAERLRELGWMCLAAMRNTTVGAIAEEFEVRPVHARPSVSSESQKADRAVKIAANVPEYAYTPYYWRDLGYSVEETDAIMASVQNSQSRQAMNAILERATGTADTAAEE